MARATFTSPTGARRTAAILLFSVAGAGVILVGLSPENTSNNLHVLGASLNFLCGNLALVLFGLALAGRRWLARFSVFAGVLGLVATGLFGWDHDLGLGTGTMERLAAYPMPVWQIVAGLGIFRRAQ